MQMRFKLCLRVAFLVFFTMTIAQLGFLNVGLGYAHDPIFIENTQVTPEDGPYLPDGNISFALYGTFEDEFDSRGFRSNLKAGNELVLSLLIPNLAPEKLLTLDQLPTLTVDRPDKSSIIISPEKREVFDEPFTGTSYLKLLSMQEPAQTGVYHITIRGKHEGRFTVSIGTIEQFGTPVEDVLDRSSNLSRIYDWYSDSPNQSVRPVTHGKPPGVRFTNSLLVIFGIAGLTLILVLILVGTRTTK